MLFNSYPFIFLFLPLTLLGFFVLAEGAHRRVAVAWLVGASLFFYGWWNPVYLWLITGSMLFNYAAGIALSSSHPYWRPKKAIMIFGVTSNLLTLGYFKYANFFVTNVNSALGTHFTLDTIILPLAISFFTFQQIAYLVDAYRGETREYNFLDYCLFVTFFPQLIAGPIVHHAEMLPQFQNPRVYRFNSRNMSIGLTIFAMGLFKKAVLADSIAIHATPVFNAAAIGQELSFFEAWGGLLAYTFQLYFDFSGYSDMAIGLGQMFNIRLPLNFFSPYKSVNTIEVWRRWHMTLSRFLRSYLYIALGGNRKGGARRYVNLMLTMILGGLWHGAGWTYVLWGTMQAVYLMINHGWHAIRRALGHDLNRSTWWGRELAWGITFFGWIISLVPFRSADLDSTLRMAHALIGGNGFWLTTDSSAATLADVASPLAVREIARHAALSPLVFGDRFWGAMWILALFLAVKFLPNTYEITRRFRPTCNDYRDPTTWLPHWMRWRPTPAWALASAAMLVMAVYQLVENSEFLYFQF